MPTTGTKLYVHKGSDWETAYAELFSEGEKKQIIEAFKAALVATGFKPEETWGERIEDRGSQITFTALGQKAPISEKELGTQTSRSARLSRRISASGFLASQST